VSALAAVLAQVQPVPVDVVGTGEAVAFWILGPLALAGGLGMVLARSAVHSALWLVLTMLCLGVLYMVQQAPFLGFVQIIVYTGAIMMLFLFVLMLVGRDAVDSTVEVLRGQRVAALLAGLGFAVLLVGALGRSLIDVQSRGLVAQNTLGGGNVANIGRALFTDYLFPFELTAALLIVATIGALLLSHSEQEQQNRRTQRQRAEERIRSARPSPLPGPGVFATGHSVANPALLPDGSVSPESLSDIIESTARESVAADVPSVTGAAHEGDTNARGGPEAAADETVAEDRHLEEPESTARPSGEVSPR